MDLRHFVLFTHLAAMAGLFSALALEGVTLRFLRRATSYEQAREWTEAWRLLPMLGAPSLVIGLASGIYLATTLGLWTFGWTRIAVPALVVVAVLGAMLGPHRTRLRTAIGTHSGGLPVEVQAQLRHPLDMASWRIRAAVLVGLVFEMTLKTDAGLLTMAPFALVGVVDTLILCVAGGGLCRVTDIRRHPSPAISRSLAGNDRNEIFVRASLLHA